MLPGYLQSNAFSYRNGNEILLPMFFFAKQCVKLYLSQIYSKLCFLFSSSKYPLDTF